MPDRLQPVKKSDICIITYYDASFRRFGDLAWESIRQYANQHHIDPIRFDVVPSDRPASWEKIRCIQKALDMGYEFVFWVDADAMIMKDAPDIRGVVANDADDSRERDFFLVRHSVDGGMSPNTGALIVRNSARARRTLSDIWNMTEFMNHRWWEQAAFLSYFGLIEGLSERERLLFEGYGPSVNRGDASSIEWIHERWNFIPHLCAVRHPNNVLLAPAIRHYAGLRWFQRLEGMIPDAIRNGCLKFRNAAFAYYVLLYCIAKARVIASMLYASCMRRIKGNGAGR